VDASQSASVTEDEMARFSAPADSVLTPQQVDKYLRTALLQFDLVHKEAPRLHQKLAEMQERGEKGGLIAGLRNVAAAGSMVVEYTDLVGGSYVRSARTLGYNPAEMEWVRERMTEVSGYLALKPMHESLVSQARTMREQAQQYRGQAGYTEEMIAQMEANAVQMEQQARASLESASAVTRNMEVLKRARGNVTEPMWGAVAFVGGPSGLLGAVAGLADPQDTATTRRFAEWRQLYRDALENKVTAGMEAGKTDIVYPGSN
jgi:hypothetical protein